MRTAIVTFISLVTILSTAAAPGNTLAATHARLPRTLQVSPPSAYTGSAVVSFTVLPRFDAPNATAEYAGVHRATVQFAVRDRAHFRIEVQFVSPVIESGTLTVVVNGSTLTSYDARSGLAFRSPMPAHPRAAILDDLLSTLLGGAHEPGGFGPLPDPTKPVSAFLALLRHPRPGSPVAFHATIVGHDTILGHPVDIIKYGPTTVKVVGNVCTRTKSGTSCRPSRYHGSGSARLWIDSAHPFLLQYGGRGTTALHDLGLEAASLQYRVTTVTYGHGPSNTDLQYEPPVTVTASPLLFSFFPQGSDSGPGPGVAPRGPFVYPAAPAVGGLTHDQGFQRLGYGPHYKIVRVTALFSSGQHGTSYFYKPTKLGPMPFVKGPYLLVQEQLRMDGLPLSLRQGTPQVAGTCQAWTGAYPDGQQWVTFMRHKAAVLISTNTLTGTQLLTYVGSLCPTVSH